jgi:hypothetical protein
VDKFGIRMLYPTKQGGEEWFIDMEDPTADGRFDPKAAITGILTSDNDSV